MTDKPTPLQGLAAYLRWEASCASIDTNRDCLRQWAREVDAASQLAPAVAVTDADISQIAKYYGENSIEGFDHIKAFAREILAVSKASQTVKPADPLKKLVELSEELGLYGDTPAPAGVA